MKNANGRRKRIWLALPLVAFFCGWACLDLHAQPASSSLSPSPSYLLLDAMGTVRLIEEASNDNPRIYDLISFGDPGLSFVDMKISSSDVLFLTSTGVVRSLRNPGLPMGLDMTKDSAVALELAPKSDGFYVLDHFGAVHAMNGAPSDWGQEPPYFGWNIARDLKITPDGKGYYVLDGYGVVHAVGSAKRFKGIYFGWDIAKDIELAPDGSGYYLMDGLGEVYFVGDYDSKQASSPPNLGWNIARDLKLAGDGSSFYVLDGFGNIYQHGPTTPLSGFPMRWDIARAFEFVDPFRAEQWIRPPVPMRINLSPEYQAVEDWQDHLEIQVRMEGATNFTECEFSVEYEPRLLSFSPDKGLLEGDLFGGLPGGTKLLSNVDKPGSLTVKCIHFTADQEAWTARSGTLLSLVFRPLSAGLGQVSLCGFRGSDARSFGSSWRLPDPAPVAVSVVSRPMKATLRIEPPDPSRTLGRSKQTVASVFLSDATDVHGICFDLSFDKEKLALVRVEEGELLKAFGPTVALFSLCSDANLTGRATDQGIVLLGRGTAAKGTGVTAFLTFEAKTTLTGAVKLERIQTLDSGGKLQHIEVKSSYISVSP